MKKILFTIVMTVLSVAAFSQVVGKLPAKEITIKKDSATAITPLLSFADYIELQNYLKDKFTVKEYEVVIAWLNARYNQRIVEYNGKLK